MSLLGDAPLNGCKLEKPVSHMILWYQVKISGELKSKSAGSTDGRTADDWERLLKEKDQTIRDKDKEMKDRLAQLKAKESENKNLKVGLNLDWLAKDRVGSSPANTSVV